MCKCVFGCAIHQRDSDCLATEMIPQAKNYMAADKAFIKTIDKGRVTVQQASKVGVSSRLYSIYSVLVFGDASCTV